MKKLCAWLGVATLAVLASSTPAHAGDPLKPYVVFAFDTSGSMGSSTGSGSPSCGGADTRLNHARCAITRIVDSYGDMVFALGRFRSTMGGTTTAATFPTGCTLTGPG
ncbi:MAG: Tryptophan synthase alpha chain, partial [Deltaproteobacteria bacterium]|nr:Tryptophan synthase alpha chain [Deltaproteobacteria bacterium]